MKLGGFDFTSDMQWFVHDDHVKLKTTGVPGPYIFPSPPYWIGPRTGTPAMPTPREVAATLDVGTSAPTGLVRWQVANANGSSGTAMFYVSRGNEIVESRSRDLPQRLPSLPVAVSGRLSRLTEVDQYEVVAERDGPISVDLMARRLGADFQAAIEVRDAANHLLADFADTQGLDGGVMFAAKAGAVYTISLHDVDFRGDRAYVYRLAVSAGPRVVCAMPAAGKRGSSCEMQFIGWGVATGKPVIEIDQAAASRSTADPAAHRILRTCCETPAGKVDVTIPLSDVRKRSSPHRRGDNSADNASAYDSSGSACDHPRRRHRFDADDPSPRRAPRRDGHLLAADEDEHRYSWSVRKRMNTGRSELHHRGPSAAGSTWPLTILDPTGRVIAENDDLPGTTDAGLEFRAGATGAFTCIARRMSSARTGSPEDLYRLQIQQARAFDFTLTVPRSRSISPPAAQDRVRRAGHASSAASTTRLPSPWTACPMA